MNRLLLVAGMICGLVIFSHAQVKVQGNATGKHAKAINSAKQSREQIKAQRERARLIKDQRKAFKKYDSGYEKLKQKRLKEYPEDSIGVAVWTKEDSLAVANEVIADLPMEYRELVKNPVNLDSLAAVPIGNVTENVIENQASEFLPDELDQSNANPVDGLTKDPLSGGTTGPPGLTAPTTTSLTKPVRPNPNLVKPTQARELFKKIDPEQFQKAQANIGKLKNKYSSLPDTRFPKEGRKRNSLEDVSFKKRIHFGGKINLSSTDPLVMDMSLQLGYWINKKWLAGVGLNMREQFNNQDSTSITGDAHGYSIFMRYDILKEFYAWGESMHQVNRRLINAETTTATTWQRSSLLGIGRDFSIGPVKMSSLIMYDFNYQNNTINSRPWVFRLGFQLTKKP